MLQTPQDNAITIAEEDQWRLLSYRLLARLLAAAPNQAVLNVLQTVSKQTTETAISQAWRSLAQAARETDPTLVKQEYDAVFIGFTSGEVIPYASSYLTGFLMEKPLVRLRQDLLDCGIQRQQSVCEPEDHIAAVLEAMSLLIESSDQRQWAFFIRHIQPWSCRFFNDLQQAVSADFYQAVARFGAAFIELETMLLSLEQ